MHNGFWGTICDDGWDLKDAQVVCRMLGYPGAVAAPLSYNVYFEGTGHIWLDEVNCLGNESSIEDCNHNDWGSHDCLHIEDAGVVCLTNDTVLPIYGWCIVLSHSTF